MHSGCPRCTHMGRAHTHTHARTRKRARTHSTGLSWALLGSPGFLGSTGPRLCRLIWRLLAWAGLLEVMAAALVVHIVATLLLALASSPRNYQGCLAARYRHPVNFAMCALPKHLLHVSTCTTQSMLPPVSTNKTCAMSRCDLRGATARRRRKAPRGQAYRASCDRARAPSTIQRQAFAACGCESVNRPLRLLHHACLHREVVIVSLCP
jgi:hypothetical protein